MCQVHPTASIHILIYLAESPSCLPTKLSSFRTAAKCISKFVLNSSLHRHCSCVSTTTKSRSTVDEGKSRPFHPSKEVGLMQFWHFLVSLFMVLVIAGSSMHLASSVSCEPGLVLGVFLSRGERQSLRHNWRKDGGEGLSFTNYVTAGELPTQKSPPPLANPHPNPLVLSLLLRKGPGNGAFDYASSCEQELNTSVVLSLACSCQLVAG